jgi:hypothetical protein
MAMKARRITTGIDALLSSLLVAAVLVALVVLAHRFPLRLDVSEEGQATLAADTMGAIEIVEERGAALKITAFGPQRKDVEAAAKERLLADFLDTLRHASPSVEATLVDLDQDRLTAERLGVDRYGTIVVEVEGDRVDVIERELYRVTGPKGKRDVEWVGEAPVAAAIRQVIAGRAKVLVSLTGHGEHTIYDRGIGELKELSTVIDDQGITVRTIDLLRDAKPGTPPAIPPDADLVLILGPRAPFAPAEEDALRTWLSQGESLAVLVDPGAPVPAFLTEFGITFPEGIVMEARTYFPHTDRPLLSYGRHPIAQTLAENDLSTVLAHARPIRTAEVEGVVTHTLLTTGGQGWIERGTESPAVRTPTEDEGGPVLAAVAAVVTPPHPMVRTGSARIVVVGDADLVSDELLAEAAGNASFVANTLRWLLRSDEQLSRVGRPVRIRHLALGPSQLEVVRWLLVGLMPALAAVGGIVVWAIRRER